MTDHAIKEAKELIGNEIVDYENLDIEGSEKTLELYRIIFSILSKLERGEIAQVVRCKDCTHINDQQYHSDRCALHGWLVNEDDFCSYGERKEQGDE